MVQSEITNLLHEIGKIFRCSANKQDFSTVQLAITPQINANDKLISASIGLISKTNMFNVSKSIGFKWLF